MIEVRGAEQFAELSRRLKETGDRDLQRELSRSVNEAVKPLRPAVRKSAQRLPNRGGLAQKVARSRLTVRKSTARNGQGVRVRAGGPRSQLDLIDKGSVWHPVFGGDARVRQSVPSGFWSEPAEALGPDLRREAEKALQRIAARLDR